MDKEQFLNQEPEVKKDNPRLGIFYFCLSGVLMCLNFLVAKVLYTTQPDMTTAELLWLRAVTATLILIVYLNRTLKVQLWDSLDRT